MQYFVEQAPNHTEAQRRIREKYGEKARIMHHRSVRIGGFLGLFRREGVEVTGYFAAEQPKRELAPRHLNIEEEKQKLLNATKREPQTDKQLDTVLAELRELKSALAERNAGISGASRNGQDHPTLEWLRKVLKKNEIEEEYRESLIEKARKSFSLEELEDRATVGRQVREWIADGVRLFEVAFEQKPEVFILVGPTGVGKTTTIAKLAAMYGVAGENGGGRFDVRILTIDNYRIGAKQQIETYGEIMGIPVGFVESAADMKKQLALYAGTDVVFLDTIGKSPSEFARLGEMKELLRAAGHNAQVHLAVSATTKASDLEEILRQFEPFNYQSVLVTKLDETARVGNLISVLTAQGKPVSFTTNGQRVPQDIARASAETLLERLEGLPQDGETISFSLEGRR
ncbi:MAG: flagellar biosynthesis protein FlhF [Spirochaetota bacterium]